MKKYRRISILLASILGFGTLTTMPIILTSCSQQENTTSQPSEPSEPSVPEKPIIPPSPPSEVIDSSGGYTTNNLYADKYKVLIDTLDLDPTSLIMNIDSLNEQNLTQKLQKEFPGLNINIAENQFNNTDNINFIVNGIYENNVFINEIINVSNFVKIDDKWIFELINTELNINQPEWFNNSLPLDSTITPDWKYNNSDLFKFINNFDQSVFNLLQPNVNEHPIKLNYALFKNSFLIKNAKLIDNEVFNNLTLKFDIKQIIKKYNGENWVDEIQSDVVLIRQNSTQQTNIQLPTEQQYFEFILNDFEITNNELKKYHTSYFYAQYLFNQWINNDANVNLLINGSNAQELINKITNSGYFKDSNFYIQININNNFEDANGVLNIIINLFENDISEQNLKTSIHKIINGFNPFSSEEIQNNSELNFKSDSPTFLKIKTILKEEIEKISESTSIHINNSNNQGLMNSVSELFKNYELLNNYQQIESNFNQINLFGINGIRIKPNPTSLNNNTQPTLFIVEKPNDNNHECFGLLSPNQNDEIEEKYNTFFIKYLYFSSIDSIKITKENGISIEILTNWNYLDANNQEHGVNITLYGK